LIHLPVLRLMNNQFWLPQESKPDLMAVRLDDLRGKIATQEPLQLAENTGTNFYRIDPGNGEFRFSLWEREVVLTYPELVTIDKHTRNQVSSTSLALVLYYFLTCDGSKPSGRWISFSELPDGRFYNQAFQGYTGGQLSSVFQNNFEQFCQAAQNLGGRRVYLLGDAAYEYNVLPLVNLLVVTWQGDEEFNATYQVLFDSAISHHLPTDAGAIIASGLSRRLIAELEKLNENRY
jgi:hypothetical protein